MRRWVDAAAMPSVSVAFRRWMTSSGGGDSCTRSASAAGASVARERGAGVACGRAKYTAAAAAASAATPPTTNARGNLRGASGVIEPAAARIDVGEPIAVHVDEIRVHVI